MIECKLKS